LPASAGSRKSKRLRERSEAENSGKKKCRKSDREQCPVSNLGDKMSECCVTGLHASALTQSYTYVVVVLFVFFFCLFSFFFFILRNYFT
jgi:hypothetical protein